MKIKQTSEYTKWFKKLRDVNAKARIMIRVKRMSEGNPGLVRDAGKGLSELKITYGLGYRIYYKQTGKEIILLLIGGDKSSQDKDIKLARKLLDNY